MADPLYRVTPLVANLAAAPFVDQSVSPLTVTTSGGVAASNDFPLFGNTTARFPDLGTGRLEFNGPGIVLGGTERTIEFWVYLTSVNPNDTSLIDTRDSAGINGMYIAVDAPDNQLDAGGYFSGPTRSGAGVFTTGAWHHIAHVLEIYPQPFSFSNNMTYRLYYDGVQVASHSGGTGAVPTASSTRMRVGDAWASGYSASGAFGPVRITRHNRYPAGASFIPPTDIFPTAYAQAPLSLMRGDLLAALSEAPLAVSHRFVEPGVLLRDMNWGGRGLVRGTVRVKGTPDFPKFARVRLVDEQTGVCIREQWSDPVTGAYAFGNVDGERRYTVLAYDPAKNLRAVVADNLSPEAT